MDPSDPSSFNHRTERLSTGNTYHFIDQIPAEYDYKRTPTLLCVHGFPDLWYGWRKVISPWVLKCGWRVIVPDMLGYGGTDKPSDPKHYTTKALSADLAALLDLVGVKQAVVLGHDWGAAIVWRFALWHPERVQALTVLSIPFTPPSPVYLSVEQMVQRWPNFGYQLYFENPVSTMGIEANVFIAFSLFTKDILVLTYRGDQLPTFLSMAYTKFNDDGNFVLPGRLQKIIKSGAPPVTTILNAEEFQYYMDNFKAGGMNGPLNYYRTTKYRFEEEVGKLPTSFPKSLPVLFLWGDKDPTCSTSRVAQLKNHVPSVRVIQIFGKGHWLMATCPDVVTSCVGEFVRSVIENAPAKL